MLLWWILYVLSILCLLCLCARLFICDLWSPAGKDLTSWLSFVVYNCELSLYLGILGQVWFLIVSIPDFCTLTYFDEIPAMTLQDIKETKRYRQTHGRVDVKTVYPPQTKFAGGIIIILLSMSFPRKLMTEMFNLNTGNKSNCF